jgi:magnesium chelatase family protein
VSVARTTSVAVSGVDGQLVEIEVDLSAGLPGTTLTGLGDKAVSEARDRVRAAIANSGAAWPNQRITIALLPADLPKVGSRFDLGIAMAVLAASDVVPRTAVAGIVWMGELGLDGRLRPVRGILPASVAARRSGAKVVVVPAENGAEAALIDGIEVLAAGTLAELVAWLRGTGDRPPRAQASTAQPDRRVVDLADVVGQGSARRALEIAAAGGHHLLLQGSPGAGKTMLAERLPGVLPLLDRAAALEVTAIHSVAGTLARDAPLSLVPPFQAPHHTASVAALVGGGTGLARPGAISLAHHGVLFLDEAPEYRPAAVDALRQPLESGRIVLHRSGGAVIYPARFQLVMAANPCGCGSPTGRDCACTPMARRRYQQRLSGPLLDRIDLHVTVHPVPRADLLGGPGAATAGESSDVVSARVLSARNAAAARWSDHGWATNSLAVGSVLRSGRWRPPRQALHLAEQALDRGVLSARGFDRVLRMAWTVCDLAGRSAPGSGDIAEALSYRTGTSTGWAA